MFWKDKAEIKRLKAQIEILEEQQLGLIHDIREMDQLIFQMSQCSSWEEMRPLFNYLQVETNFRMQEESKRIQAVMIPELKKAYLK